MTKKKNYFNELIGIQKDFSSPKEKIISALGGLISIFLILYVSDIFVTSNSALIVASMGASAVLLFAVPHGPLSQPWPVAGGHVLSAIIGVSCYKYISPLFLAAALAVGISIGIMYYLRCIHPPGGATALSAVMGGGELHQLGYDYVITPVLINVLIILGVAVSFNYLFKWRRYPAVLAVKADEKVSQTGTEKPVKLLQEADFEYALNNMPSFIDISEAALQRIYQTALEKKSQQKFRPDEIILGHYYLHGKQDGKGVIRRIIDESDNKEMVIYKIITGPDRKQTHSCSRESFAKWAKHEVVYENNEWQIKIR